MIIPAYYISLSSLGEGESTRTFFNFTKQKRALLSVTNDQKILVSQVIFLTRLSEHSYISLAFLYIFINFPDFMPRLGCSYAPVVGEVLFLYCQFPL